MVNVGAEYPAAFADADGDRLQGSKNSAKANARSEDLRAATH